MNLALAWVNLILLKSLKGKGQLKLEILKEINKLGYAYILTPKGISTKTKLTLIL